LESSFIRLRSEIIKSTPAPESKYAGGFSQDKFVQEVVDGHHIAVVQNRSLLI